jgi:spore coat protein U-like protein
VRRKLACVAILASAALCSKGALAITSCSFVSVVGVAFGGYDVFDVVPLASTGSLTFRCNGVLQNETIVIDLSAGNSGDALARTLTGTTTPLSYNLYLDAAHTLVWGNGAGGTSHHGPTTPPDAQDVTVTVFGLIPDRQSVVAGSYSDTIVATILF